MNPLMNIFNFLYTKKGFNIRSIKVDASLNIIMSKWITRDKSNIENVSDIYKDYIFSIDPLHYFYLLFFSIPQKLSAPYLPKIKKGKKKELNVFELEVKRILGWSNNEWKIHKNLIDKLITKDKKKWKTEFGMK